MRVTTPGVHDQISRVSILTTLLVIALGVKCLFREQTIRCHPIYVVPVFFLLHHFYVLAAQPYLMITQFIRWNTE